MGVIMYIKKLFGLTLFVLFLPIFFANAEQDSGFQYRNYREEIIREYLKSIEQASYLSMEKLFATDGIVISTSQGKQNARVFFSNFLPSIQIAHTQIHQIFFSEDDPNHFAGRFHLDFELKDGQKVSGEYMDEFIFTDGTIKLSAVYMFENLHFQE